MGDTVGVIWKNDETIRFTINGEDQGIAATDVTAGVYGVVDLFAQTSKVTIVDHSGGLTHYGNFSFMFRRKLFANFYYFSIVSFIYAVTKMNLNIPLFNIFFIFTFWTKQKF